MSTDIQPRKPKGQPVGGQFDNKAQSDDQVDNLVSDPLPDCPRCGSNWGGDTTCGLCCDDDGHPREVPPGLYPSLRLDTAVREHRQTGDAVSKAEFNLVASRVTAFFPSATTIRIEPSDQGGYEIKDVFDASGQSLTPNGAYEWSEELYASSDSGERYDSWAEINSALYGFDSSGSQIMLRPHLRAVGNPRLDVYDVDLADLKRLSH